jgi:hypothetical protein
MEQTMEIDELPENDERLLKKPEIKRDETGRFDRHGKTLANTAKKAGLNKKSNETPGGRGANLPARGPGRPPGSQNKVTVALKEAILAAGERAGGKEGLTGYLTRLAVENSSAYAGLLGKVLPTTLHADESSGGIGVKMVFERVLVHPDGRREVEGVTPKALPAPDGDKDQ